MSFGDFTLGDDLVNAAASDFSPIPDGWYKVQCVSAERKATKDGDGEYIKCVFNVVDDKYGNRKLFQNFNIKNKSAQATSIGMGQLKSYMLSAGFLLPVIGKSKLPTCLLNTTATVKVIIKKDPAYGESNVITGYKTPAANTTSGHVSDVSGYNRTPNF